MHVLRNKRLDRRTLLRGALGSAGVFLALPPLEAMLDAHGTALAGGEPLPRQFISFLWGNGMQLGRFEPNQVGADWALSELLMPFAPVKDYLTVCTGLHNHCEEFITHHEGLIGLNGYTYILRPDLPGFASDWGGPTIDQLIADHIAASTPTPVHSLQVQISKFLSTIDNGTTAEGISARGEPGNVVALPADYEPVSVWERLFGEFVPDAGDSAHRLTMLDLIRDDAERLRGQLGVSDGQRLDAHLQGVYELEQKIAALPPSCDLPAVPTLVNTGVNGQEPLTEVNRVMSDLIAQAFLCDVTRVASVLFLGIAGEVVLSQAGVTNVTHHQASHSDTEPYAAGVTYIMARIADLMMSLRNVELVTGGTLLDSAMVYATSDCAVGWTHSVRRQPILLGGGGGGHLVHPGIHYQAVPADGSPTAPNAPSEGNMSDVLLACLQGFDPSATSIGGGAPMSTTPLTEIIA
ncbi:MAG: DUF1552 domain-containing protein [Deltaproteobacteria bacterium]|nr:DUF1552 domain-containing protein [Deltaproteobacteria bacterium]